MSSSLSLPKSEDNCFTLFLSQGGKHKISSAHKKYTLTAQNFLLLSQKNGLITAESHPPDSPFLWLRFSFTDYQCLEGDISKAYIDLMCMPETVKRLAKNTPCDMLAIPESGKLSYKTSIELLFSQLLSSKEKENYFSQSYMNYAISLIMMEITQEYLNHYTRSRSSTLIGDIQEWLAEHLEDTIDIEFAANHFGYNPRYLTTLFKKHTGYSMMEYAHKLKLDYAKNLLTASDTSVQKIAYSLGYKDEKYFMKLFKQQEGITPTQYRNSFYLKNQKLP